MKITPILTQLREQCPTLANRVFAALDLAALQTGAAVPVPCAYVLPTTDVASPNTAQNVTLQTVRDGFDVVLVLEASDVATALDGQHDLRAELWRALVGFKPGADYTGIEYDGSEPISPIGGHALFRLRFFAQFQLGRNLTSQLAESWHERELDGLSSFTGATVRVDAIDPADPNLKRPGPDGRLELTFSGDVTP
ncbi:MULTISPECIES: phage tail terminator protein [Pseudomonas]|uniref:Prophage PSSSM-04 n=2 Tax=Pseudomonas TaxID=286 RepID=A0A423G3N8_9PSED|nr:MULTISPECIES: hypothetical protein [Pseudomonas]KIQ59349.1 prophage PSSSM-04 [Pseudomonas fluorescens]ROM80013.1 hypothetical protein BK652_21215 [Pseudomonas brassicacearum]